jgi:hypothetical protein
VLDKTARWFFPNQDPQAVVNQIGGALYNMAVPLAPWGPLRWQGIGTSGSYGITPKVFLAVVPDQGGFWLDVRLQADLQMGPLILFVVLWASCFPIAIVLLLLGSQSWQRRADELVAAMQAPVAHLQSAPGWASPKH